MPIQLICDVSRKQCDMSDAPHLPAREDASQATGGGPTTKSQPAGARPFFSRIFGSLAGATASRTPSNVRDARRAIALCHVLLSERGEVSGLRLAREVLSAYRSFDALTLDAFFDLLVKEFSPDPYEIDRAIETYRQESSPANLVRLQAVIEGSRQELFRRCNIAPGGTGVLVQMRRKLLATLAEHPERAGIDADLLHLFRSWFNRGFLVLQRIDWRTSAAVLERLIRYEAVHQIQGWSDLRRRLEADRRCYAFFHPAFPDEPLIFIEVALIRGLSAKVQPLLDPNSLVLDPATANCAIFYSITNCQEGLRGVSFGYSLIKQVVEDLGRELPRLRTFGTLSPVPGFRKWLETWSDTRIADVRSPQLMALLAQLDRRDPQAPLAIRPHLRAELIRSCAYYLLHAKHGKAPLDPVARFHLANGARLERLNWLGDISEKGMQQSVGLMVNYVYHSREMDRNHEAYAKDYRIIASHELERLAKQCLIAHSRSG
jgi:malonyl-CoA decarboxylase